MVISVYGAGYVGLVSAICLAKLGHEVICADIDEQKITLLSQGECSIYEEQLPQLLQEQLASGRLCFTASLVKAIKSATIHIIATGTPSLNDGGADLSQVFAVASMVAQEVEKDGILVTKSTVPVGTGDALQELINAKFLRCGKKISLNVVSNPEFLREGTAVNDFLKADRIIIGGTQETLVLLKQLYQPLVEKGVPLLCMSRRSAELTKYAANAMLASKISFINQISCLADGLGANIDEICQGIALDHRIGPHFLRPGIGYGGSCFPKDVRALIHTAQSLNVDSSFLQSIESINQLQKNWIFQRLAKHFANQLEGLTVGIWGLSFKPGTDDLREASSLVAVKSLIESGVHLRIFDPVAMPTAQRLFDNILPIAWCNSPDEVLDGKLDALIIATEWPEFKNYCLQDLQEKLGEAPLIDGRNCFNLAEVAGAQLTYYSVGRPLIHG